MPHNVLVTGEPRSGKTTVVQRVVDRLHAEDLTVGGVVCPEIRVRDERVGFEIQDVLTGESSVLAHVNRDWGPSVGKYRVAVQETDERCEQAFSRALAEADVFVVDEIAPMEVHSEAFVDGVSQALDDERPLVGVVHQRSTSGFIGEVKRRPDVESITVTAESRDDLPERITGTVLGWVKD